MHENVAKEGISPPILCWRILILKSGDAWAIPVGCIPVPLAAYVAAKLSKIPTKLWKKSLA